MATSQACFGIPLKVFGRAIRRGRLAHAYALSGPSLSGSEDFALCLAEIICCQRPDFSAEAPWSCGECPACIKARHGAHPDIVVIRPEGLLVKLHQVRELQRSMAFPPLESALRVAIITHAHSMTMDAANAMLKTLEEPSGGNLLLLVTPSIGDLLPTIASRCQEVRVPSPQDEGAEDGRGELEEMVFDLLERPRSEAIPRVLAVAGRCSGDNSEALALVRVLRLVARDLLALSCRGRVDPSAFSSGSRRDVLLRIHKGFRVRDIAAYTEWLDRVEGMLDRNVNRDVLLLAALCFWVGGGAAPGRP